MQTFRILLCASILWVASVYGSDADPPVFHSTVGQPCRTDLRREWERSTALEANSVVRAIHKRWAAILAHKLSFTLDLSEEIPRVLVGQDDLSKALTNLLINAIHAIGERNGRISIRTSVAALAAPRVHRFGTVPAGRYVQIDVQDDGVGIPENVLPNIFFFGFTTKGAGGSGIGLASVLEFVKKNAGAIVVESDPAGGRTVFSLFFVPWSDE